MRRGLLCFDHDDAMVLGSDGFRIPSVGGAETGTP